MIVAYLEGNGVRDRQPRNGADRGSADRRPVGTGVRRLPVGLDISRARDDFRRPPDRRIEPDQSCAPGARRARAARSRCDDLARRAFAAPTRCADARSPPRCQGAPRSRRSAPAYAGDQAPRTRALCSSTSRPESGRTRRRLAPRSRNSRIRRAVMARGSAASPRATPRIACGSRLAGVLMSR